jgi:outer membrane protein TolC
MKLKNYIFIWVFWLTTAIATAQSSQPLTLKEAVNYALQHNVSIRTALLNKQNVAYQVREAKSIALPQVNASVNYDNNLKLPRTVLPFNPAGTTPEEQAKPSAVELGTRHNLQGQVELQQMIYDQAYWTGLKAVKKAGELNQLEISQAKEEVAFQVAQAYYLAQVANRQKEIYKSNLDKNLKLLEITTIQYKNGVVQKVDLDRIKVNQVNLQTELENLENAYQQSINYLKYMMGIEQSQAVSLADSVQTMGLMPENTQADFQSRLSIQLLQKNKELEMLDMKRTQSGYYPNLTAFARYSVQNYFIEGQDWFDASTVGLRLNVPIFDGFQKSNKMQQAGIRIQKIDLQTQNQTAYLQMEHANILNRLRNKQSVITQQTENMQLADEVYQTTQTQYKNGVATLSDLLNAETSLRESQTAYFTALLQAKIAELEYIKSNGYLLTILN